MSVVEDDYPEGPTPDQHLIPPCDGYHTRYFFRFFICEVIGVSVLGFTNTIYGIAPVPQIPGTVMMALAHCFSIWLCGPISGAELHPGVTLALLISRRVTYPYIILGLIAQLLGGIAGCGVAMLVAGVTPTAQQQYGVVMIPAGRTVGQALGIEVIGSFIFSMFVLSTLDERRTDAWSKGQITLLPLGIVPVFTLIASFMAGISGGGVNPAVTLGSAIANLYFTNQWVYVLGGLLGGVCGVCMYEMVLSNAISIPRYRAWCCDRDFDRNEIYE